MRLSNFIVWAIVLLLLFPSTRRLITAPLLWILGVMGIIAIGSSNNSRKNRGL